MPFGGPYNKDYRILRSMLESPHLGTLPFRFFSKYDAVRDDICKVQEDPGGRVLISGSTAVILRNSKGFGSRGFGSN